MLPQTPRYLVQRSRNQWGSESENCKRHRPYEDLLTTVKRRKLKQYGHVTRSSGLANPTGNSPRRKTKRQIEETMGRQHQRVDWPSMEHHIMES